MIVRVLPSAQAELTEIVAHYTWLSPVLGQRALDEFLQAVANITDFPLAWPVYYREYRAFNFRKFPFRIIYLPGEDIVVYAVSNVYQDPERVRDQLDMIDE